MAVRPIPAASTTSRSGTDYGYQPGKLVPDGTCHIPFGGGEVIQPPPFQVLYATGGGRPQSTRRTILIRRIRIHLSVYRRPYAQPQPYPPCNPSTPASASSRT